MLNQLLISELHHETASTRKMLERVPFDKWDWKPHEKSFTLGRLASHIATIPEWMTITISTDELDFSKGDYRPPVLDSKESLLRIFENASEKRRKHYKKQAMKTLWEHGRLKTENMSFSLCPALLPCGHLS